MNIINNLHFNSIIIDGHCDSILETKNNGRNLNFESAKGQFDFPRMVKGGVNLQFIALFIESEFKPDYSLKRTIELLDIFYENYSQYHLIRGKEDLQKIAIDSPSLLLSIEGGEALEGKIEVLRILYKLGIRSITLTWNQKNEIAHGVGEKETCGGLTSFGKKVIQEMNRLGMLIDISHISEEGFWDVIKATNKPIVASHSCAYSLCKHPRNLNNKQLKAIAGNGGVVGINFCPIFLREDGNATIEDIVNHIEYIANLIGYDHVGLGSDFDGIDKAPLGIEDVTKMSKLTEIMLSRNISEADIVKVLGENFLRVLNQVL